MNSARVLTYFDANVLVYRAQATVSSCPGMPSRVGPQVEALITDEGRQALTSDLGVLEFRNTLAKCCRNTQPTMRSFNAEWMSDAVTGLMVLIKDGTLEVLTTRPQASQQASALVDLAARNHGRAFGTWDTIHVITAAATARERGASVEIVTADKGFAKFFDMYPQFGKSVNVLQLEDETE